jgi:hypothetical protein
MVQYVVTKLSRDSDYECAESRTWILEVKLNQKYEATESCGLLLQPRIYLVFLNQVNIEGDMVQ